MSDALEIASTIAVDELEVDKAPAAGKIHGGKHHGDHFVVVLLHSVDFTKSRMRVVTVAVVEHV